VGAIRAIVCGTSMPESKDKKLASKVNIPANVSSQYISALMLVAPKLENGIEINLAGEITSVPSR
jgi:5-enolpyruvylshikimate-3-phosphate synthase